MFDNFTILENVLVRKKICYCCFRAYSHYQSTGFLYISKSTFGNHLNEIWKTFLLQKYICPHDLFTVLLTTCEIYRSKLLQWNGNTLMLVAQIQIWITKTKSDWKKLDDIIMCIVTVSNMYNHFNESLLE
jgi:hypothetical protein